MIDMRIYRLLIVLGTILTGAVTLHAQTASEVERLKGTWQIEKVVVKLYAQQGGTLLEEKTYISTDSLVHVNAFVPLEIQFSSQVCIITHRAGQEAGKYTIPVNGILDYERGGLSPQTPEQQVLQTEYTYQLLQSTKLAINMPPAFYRDNVRNLPVKLVYTCYYRKKP
jgi:hypothetical protein